VFVRELEVALLAGEIDLAVHSLKDLPTALPPGLEIVAILERGDPRDALACPAGMALEALPAGARLGTGSPRRAAQLRAHRPDLEFLPIRGNLDTRWRKACQGEVEALVVAAVGLHRLGWHRAITQYLPPELCLPAVGQGALAVEARVGDEEIAPLAAALDHAPSRQAVTAERAFLQALGGGCHIPIAALGHSASGQLSLHGLVATTDGRQVLRGELGGSAEEPEALGQALARQLLDMGAAQLLGDVPTPAKGLP